MTLSNKTIIELSKEYLPLVSLYIIILGMVRLTSFYSFFDIDIIPFLEITEVIQLQYNYFALAFVLTIAFTVIRTLFLNPLYPFDEENEANKSKHTTPVEITQEKKEEFIKQVNKVLDVFFVLCTIFSILLMIGVIIHKARTKNILVVPAIEAILMLVAFLLLIKASRRLNHQWVKMGMDEQNATKILSLITFVIVTFSFTYIGSRSNAFFITTRMTDQEVTLVLEGRTISTNKHLIFIGKIKNYLFLYDKKNMQSEVYPMSEIKELKYRAGTESKYTPVKYQVRYEQ